MKPLLNFCAGGFGHDTAVAYRDFVIFSKPRLKNSSKIACRAGSCRYAIIYAAAAVMCLPAALLGQTHSWDKKVPRLIERIIMEGKKTIWEIVKFILVSCIVSIIQLILVNALFFLMREWKAPLPDALAAIFSAETVGAGNDNWGYVLPFFLSNLIANIYGYFQNRKTTFKAEGVPKWSVWVYICIIIALILFSTWLQGVVANVAISSGVAAIAGLAPTLAAMAAGTFQLLVLFPLEKFVLFKERKQ